MEVIYFAIGYPVEDIGKPLGGINIIDFACTQQ
jgi:hypothetical protein